VVGYPVRITQQVAERLFSGRDRVVEILVEAISVEQGVQVPAIFQRISIGPKAIAHR
jgi:hypothetical protein